jgi:uncharacterized HAD superfamily protein
MPKPANKPVIAVDIDEVMFPMVPDLISYLDREHSVRLSQADFIKYNLEEIWKGDPAEALELFESYKNQVGIEVAPIKGAAEALHKLSLKYDVIVMTARDIKVEDITRSWLNHHFPELFKEVHLLGNRKDSVSYRNKAEVCKELGVFCLIDDSLKHVIETNAAGIKTILFGDYPWNQIDELPSGVIRVEDWQGVLEYLDGRS